MSKFVVPRKQKRHHKFLSSKRRRKKFPAERVRSGLLDPQGVSLIRHKEQKPAMLARILKSRGAAAPWVITEDCDVDRGEMGVEFAVKRTIGGRMGTSISAIPDGLVFLDEGGRHILTR